MALKLQMLIGALIGVLLVSDSGARPHGRHAGKHSGEDDTEKLVRKNKFLLILNVYVYRIWLVFLKFHKVKLIL